MSNYISPLDLYLSKYVVLVRRYYGIIVLLDGAKLYVFLRASINHKIKEKLKLEVKNGYRYFFNNFQTKYHVIESFFNKSVFLSIPFILNFS